MHNTSALSYLFICGLTSYDNTPRNHSLALHVCLDQTEKHDNRKMKSTQHRCVTFKAAGNGGGTGASLSLMLRSLVVLFLAAKAAAAAPGSTVQDPQFPDTPEEIGGMRMARREARAESEDNVFMRRHSEGDGDEDRGTSAGAADNIFMRRHSEDGGAGYRGTSAGASDNIFMRRHTGDNVVMREGDGDDKACDRLCSKLACLGPAIEASLCNDKCQASMERCEQCSCPPTTCSAFCESQKVAKRFAKMRGLSKGKRRKWIRRGRRKCGCAKNGAAPTAAPATWTCQNTCTNFCQRATKQCSQDKKKGGCSEKRIYCAEKCGCTPISCGGLCRSKRGAAAQCVARGWARRKCDKERSRCGSEVCLPGPKDQPPRPRPPNRPSPPNSPSPRPRPRPPNRPGDRPPPPPPLHHPLVSALKSYLWSSKTCRWDGPRRTETSRRSRIRPGHTFLKFTVMRLLG